MKIILEDLPAEVTSDDIHEFLHAYVEIRDLEIYVSQQGERTSAWVGIVASHAEARWAVDKINGRYWRDRTVRAYLSLFSDNT